MKKEPKIGEVWKNVDGELCIIVNIRKNKLSGIKDPYVTYKIIEHSFSSGFNTMEADRNNLVKYIGKSSIGDPHLLFETKKKTDDVKKLKELLYKAKVNLNVYMSNIPDIRPNAREIMLLINKIDDVLEKK